jgi:hypothetical protein
MPEVGPIRAAAGRCALVVLALLAPASVDGGDDEPETRASPSVPAPFSGGAGRMPEGWEPLHFPKIPRHTGYDLVLDEGVWVVRASSRAAASGYTFPLRVDLRRFPLLRWRWKVENVLEGGDVRSRSGDDYPARIYVTFEYDPGSVGLWKRARYLAARQILGDLPIGAITYIWASHAEVGSVVGNAYARSFVKMIVVESGPERLGQWREETRDLYADFERAFGEEPPLVNGIAIMTDTDNTGESAVAYYGDIRFLPAGSGGALERARER